MSNQKNRKSKALTGPRISNSASNFVPVGKYNPISQTRLIRMGNREYHILPIAKLFLCFSGNTAIIAFEVQAELLRNNIRPGKYVDWIPYAWNIYEDINAYGDNCGYDVQDILNSHINECENVIFLVKDKMGPNQKREWDFCLQHSEGKKILIGFYGEGPSDALLKKYKIKDHGIYFVFKTKEDVLNEIYKYVRYQDAVTSNSSRLRLIETPDEADGFKQEIYVKLRELKRTQASPKLISRYKVLFTQIENRKIELKAMLPTLIGPIRPHVAPVTPSIPLTSTKNSTKGGNVN